MQIHGKLYFPTSTKRALSDKEKVYAHIRYGPTVSIPGYVSNFARKRQEKVDLDNSDHVGEKSDQLLYESDQLQCESDQL